MTMSRQPPFLVPSTASPSAFSALPATGPRCPPWRPPAPAEAAVVHPSRSARRGRLRPRPVPPFSMPPPSPPAAASSTSPAPAPRAD